MSFQPLITSASWQCSVWLIRSIAQTTVAPLQEATRIRGLCSSGNQAEPALVFRVLMCQGGLQLMGSAVFLLVPPSPSEAPKTAPLVPVTFKVEISLVLTTANP